ncbi:hypothetical protein Avbf_09675 [Armadillidium vulgare]|nr:hypothetical protein Avbf_09675 [Armadillidium vulgare]
MDFGISNSGGYFRVLTLTTKCVSNTQSEKKRMSIQIEDLPAGELTLVFKTIAFLYSENSSKEIVKIFYVCLINFFLVLSSPLYYSVVWSSVW